MANSEKNFTIEFAIRKCIRMPKVDFLVHTVIKLEIWCPFYPISPMTSYSRSMFDVFQKMDITIAFSIGKYIWVPSFSFLVKPVVMLQ